MQKKLSDLVDCNQLPSEDQSNVHKQSPRASLMKENLHKVEAAGKSKCYCGKKLGKILLCILWALLILIHVILIRKGLREIQFLQWITLSLTTFLVQLLLIDPLIYLILAAVLTSLVTENRAVDYWGNHFSP
mmetsp:Transcript_9600/g.9258  ORF Transcript_9600/g.9258 Transcript_9600/m.9258 type:complete len:132 (+) Transcript_9600:805-1200(+)